MDINVPLESDKYLIVPTGFEPYQNVTPNIIKQYAKKKLFYNVFGEEVKKVFRGNLVRLMGDSIING